MKTLDQLTGLYSLSKTLRFELKPIGKTIEHIERKGLIAQDEQRAEEYKKVKDIIDKYHKYFISMCLGKLQLDINDLEQYVSLAEKKKRSAEEEKDFDEIKAALRNQIVKAFKEGGSYDELFKKVLIQKHLPAFVTDDEEKRIVNNFSKFTTYFTGFHENRKNIYTDEEKSTAIAYRLIHENLPMFLDNIKSFTKIAKSDINEHFSDIENAFSKDLNVEHLSDMFQLDYFSDTLTQKQISVYNYIIGGKTEEDGTKIQGLNEYVNLYNQKHKDSRLPLLKPLYKMILSDRVPLSWLPDEFVSDEEMLKAINETHNLLKDTLAGEDGSSLYNLLLNIDKYDTEHIYIANDQGLTDISQQIYGHYDVYTNSIKKELRTQVVPTPKERRAPELYDKRIDDLFKSAKSFSIAYLNSCIDDANTIQNYFMQLGAYNRNGEQRINLFRQIEMAYIAASDVLSGNHSDINQSDADIALIKNLLDAYKALQHFIKPLLGNGDEADKDNDFDAQLRAAWNMLDIVTPLYNKVRNWLTRKPYSTEKIKLNFENNGSLLNGWVDSKTEQSDNGTQYGGYIFRKMNEIGEYDFFLGISADTKLFRRDESCVYKRGMYERLDYYQIKGKTILGNSYRGCYKEDSEKVLKIFADAIKSKGIATELMPVDEETIVSYLKRLKQSDLDIYNSLINDCLIKTVYDEMKNHLLKTLESLYRVDAAIELSKRGRNMDIDEIIDAINSLPSKSFSFFPVDETEIMLANKREEKTLFLFKITNKDLSFAETFTKGLRKNRGTDNLHTMYFKALFSMEQGVYDIGIGEVFFRQQTKNLKNITTVHPANKAIINKNTQNTKKSSVFSYDIIKNRRFTCDKFQLHLSININYDKPKSHNINKEVQNIIRHNGIEHVIGIDRGERHLLYLSLIDLKGNIVKQMTLNDIVNEYQGNTYSTNYKELLAERESDRTKARRNWKKIENIKDIKEGYLSQVIHILSQMMVDYNAIVVLEDLNMGFMRGRQKIERNVYEQFEKKLIDKLNYYVDKQKGVDEIGGILHALQMTNKFESFKKLGKQKQSGCLFYIPAWNTSKIDPVTGFVNMFDTRYENADKACLFFSKFDVIRYNAAKDWFEFVFDYNNFTTKAEGTQTRWTLCTYGTRIRTFRNPAKQNQWDDEEIVLTNEFKRVFQDAGIDINGNLKEAIRALTDKKHLEPMMHLMKLMLQIRNSKTNTEIDYLLSPVSDGNGHFYDSRTCSCQLHKDADANGAYNIARKGLLVIRKIQDTAVGERPNLAISNKEWLDFVQKKPYLDD